jgi:hypothetical protein
LFLSNNILGLVVREPTACGAADNAAEIRKSKVPQHVGRKADQPHRLYWQWR